jgi:mRNA interferase MazF
MPSCSKNDVILVRYPFSDLTSAKIRPAVIVGRLDRSPDCLIVPLTSRTSPLSPGEVALADWKTAGLNVPSVIKRGIYTIHSSIVLKSLGQLSTKDAIQVEQSLRIWLEL